MTVILASVSIAALVACSSQKDAPATSTTTAQTASPPASSPAPIVIGPGDPRFIEADLPVLPDNLPYAARPADVVRQVYAFAAKHGEVLKYVPCFCGCERMGHRGNEDCFVKTRDVNGDVVEWEDHGMECAVCLDVATRARLMFASGASVADIRAAVEKEWAGRSPTHTPTPEAPHQH